MTNILEKFYIAIDTYLRMDINGLVINCPYWANHMENGIVTVRGFEDGKGESRIIKDKITSLVNEYIKEEPTQELNQERIHFLAHQNRVGIDCSGLVYRLMESILQQNDLNLMFPKGVRRTNANMLTHNSFSRKIENVTQIKVGDLIRVSAGHHLVMVTSCSNHQIKYVHSSSRTEVNGVHMDEIVITDPTRTIENQQWQEKTYKHYPWKDKYFHSEEGDGVYRNELICRLLNEV